MIDFINYNGEEYEKEYMCVNHFIVHSNQYNNVNQLYFSLQKWPILCYVNLISRLPWWFSSENPPAMHETWVWPLGQEDLLEKEMATHSSILA